VDPRPPKRRGPDPPPPPRRRLDPPPPPMRGPDPWPPKRRGADPPPPVKTRTEAPSDLHHGHHVRHPRSLPGAEEACGAHERCHKEHHAAHTSDGEACHGVERALRDGAWERERLVRLRKGRSCAAEERRLVRMKP
jgi:hypothetical protein